MTGLAIKARSNMWTVIKFYKVWYSSYWYPLNWLILFNCLNQRLQKHTGFGDTQLLMTAPAFRLGRQASYWSARGALMTIQTLNAETNMAIMWKLDWLFRCDLC